MKRSLAIALCILCAACGSFPLGTVGPRAGKTADQEQLDILVCKDTARIDSQTADAQTRGFMLGLTLSVVGVAIDYEQQKTDQRRIFKDCMEAKGYTVRSATN